ncbi:MAG: restriction endonuclease [Limnothrix sp. RL_2_0]|nr:restriction endonuclease [Limnothrix sp. RL_2_0]
MNVSKTAIKKSQNVRYLIHSALHILKAVGVPLDDLTPRRLERIGMCLLALSSITSVSSWKTAKSVSSGHILKTRDIIGYLNQYFEEEISSSSYDDIRRKDLIRLVDMGLVIKSANNPNADTNDGTRGYALSNEFANLIQAYETSLWEKYLDEFEIDDQYVKDFRGDRDKKKIEVFVDDNVIISLDDGPHNQIQKAVIDDFLAIYGYHARVLYVGDTSNKKIHQYSELMIELGLNLEERGILPDIIAFSDEKQWLYLIEAVHSSNPLNPERCIQLKRNLLNNCPYDVVFVTAFLNKKEFAKWVSQIAWETEVWLADTPEHLIHFNGDKFLGPH